MVSLRSVIVAALTAISFAGSAAIVVSGWQPVTLDVPNASTLVEPETVSRNLNCSGSVLAAIDDSTTWTRVGKVTHSITGGNRAAQFATDTEPDGAIVAYDQSPHQVAATESAALNNEVVRGYLLAECGDPTNSQWLVGGSTTTGRDAILTISNGAGVDALIDLEFWGAQGPIAAPAASGLVVPAQSSKSYSLAGFAPNEKSPVVHVISNGAPVWATLQVSTVRGLTPGGLDRVAPVGEPATSLVIPIVRQPDEELVGPLRIDPDYNDTVTTVRLLAPGDADGTATVTVLPLDGSDPVSIDSPLVAGEVLDVTVDELVSGDFSILVDADVPVVASTKFSTYSTASEIVDMAWAPAVPSHRGPAMTFVPVSRSTLVLVNNTETDANTEVVSAGDSTSVTVTARGSVVLTVARGALTVTSDGQVAAGVLVVVPEGIGTLRLPVEPLGARSVTVIAH